MTAPLLSLRDVARTHWRGETTRVVLRGVSLEVCPGQLVAVYGARGSGKTTLLQIAAGLELPDSGTVMFEGEDVHALSRRRQGELRRDQIAWVERIGPHSSAVSVGLHVALPLYDEFGPFEAQHRAACALDTVGAAKLGGRRWADLWNADRIRVALAQALVREPKLLVVDDPTVGLDVVERESVLSVVRSAAEEGGLGVLMAVPDTAATLPATDIRLLARGRLISPSDDSNVVEFPGHRRRA